MEAIQLDRGKLLDVVHYACAKCDPRELGKVKLHKILYFSDMLHYAHTGRPLTGVEYQKQQFGPMAKHLGWALSKLAEEGRIKIDQSDYFGFAKFIFTSQMQVSSNRFSHDEITLLNDVIDFVCNKATTEISELSHNSAWNAADMGETMPYFTAFDLFPVEVTEDDISWGKHQAELVMSGRH